MSIFAIGDPHLSLGCNKEMNIFAGWHDYVQRLEQNWLERISSEDTVILAGDISWAMNIEDTCRFYLSASPAGRKVPDEGQSRLLVDHPFLHAALFG